MSEARPATFDSATAMVAATARFLAGRDFPILGMEHGDRLRPILAGLNRLPRPVRDWIYRVGSGREGLPADVVAGADADALAAQVVDRYPPGRYPAALVGSTPGSAVHLAAAMRAPLLPQTLLLPLARRHVGVDEPAADLEAARPVAARLVDRNPDLVVHQMFDPCQDRLTLARFTYFRVKRLRLGPAYEDFLLRSLQPGATIFVVCSGHSWPVTAAGERHYFQFGGVGAVSPEEYRRGSPRISRFLASQGSTVDHWDPPPVDGEQPEAEWGFDEPLLDDVRRFADRHGFGLQVIRFDRSDDLSPVVADLYRDWYREMGRPADRLYGESFVLLDPYWALRASAVPYWMTFNSDAAADHLETYLDRGDPYSEMDVALIANGMTAPGLAPLDRWRKILARAERRGGFAGTDPDRFPSDLASFARYRDPLRRAEKLYPLPPPIDPGTVARRLAAIGPGYGVSVGD